MLSNPAAILSLRTWRRRVLGGSLALGLAMGLVRDQRPQVTMVEACRAAALDAAPEPAAQRRVAGACLPPFLVTRDPATGARAARALAAAPGSRRVVEWIAGAVGDHPAGVDAWLAVGRARRADDDAAGAVTAYLRGLDHRAPGDLAGQIRDTNGLLLAYQDLGDYQHAALAAAALHERSARGVSARERRMSLLNIAAFLVELGNLETTRRLLDEVAAITTPEDSAYVDLQELLGIVEHGRGHPHAARRALTAAREAADRRQRDAWTIYLNLVEVALDAGDVAEASALIARAPQTPATANDRAIAAYYQVRLLDAQGRFAEAARVGAQALVGAPKGWKPMLEAVRGHALRRAGAADEAERSLLRAIDGLEAQRSAIGNDTLKSWMLAKRRAPFEELFLLYVEHDRAADALAIAQRATARSVLDGLVATLPAAGTVHAEIASAGSRLAALRSLARSLRASPSAEVPPIATVIERLRGHHVVTYFRADRELWAIAITRDRTVIARRLGDASELGRAVSDWLAQPDRDDLAEQLGMRLLPDALAPAIDEALYVIPDEPIRAVTFASLRRHGAYVAERNPVGYGLSATSLSIAHRPAGTAPAVVVGDPLGDLPSARVEANDVARLLGVRPVLGAAATRAVLRAAEDAWLLHVAAHTDPTAQGPAIHLADGPLDAATVLERPITTRLVMLLGCSSARAKERDELAPLAAAFLAAGAHTVVASLWAVDDRIAHRFAREIYESGGIKDPVRATATAQRALMRAGVPVSQWSTFVVLGGLRDKGQGDLE